MDLRRETDTEQLRRVAIAQQVQNEQLLRVQRAKCDELAALKGGEGELQQTLSLVADLTRQAQSVAAQLGELPKGGFTDACDDKPRKRARSGPAEQPLLPVVEETFKLDVADQTCPSCGGELSPMKGQFETSEMVDVVEVSYRVVKVQQQKYSCRRGACIETTPGPERAIAGGRYSLDCAVKVAIDKYLDHIPLARQERILRRHGLIVTTQALWDQLNALGRRLESASRALLARALAQPVVGLDQTSWPRLDGKGDKPWQMVDARAASGDAARASAARAQTPTARVDHKVPDAERRCAVCGNDKLDPLGDGKKTTVWEFVPSRIVGVEHMQEVLRWRRRRLDARHLRLLGARAEQRLLQLRVLMLQLREPIRELLHQLLEDAVMVDGRRNHRPV